MNIFPGFCPVNTAQARLSGLDTAGTARVRLFFNLDCSSTHRHPAPHWPIVRVPMPHLREAKRSVVSNYEGRT